MLGAELRNGKTRMSGTLRGHRALAEQLGDADRLCKGWWCQSLGAGDLAKLINQVVTDSD